MRKAGQQDKGQGDPNIFKIEDGAKIRLLDDNFASWKQHTIEHPDDDEQVKFVTCPGPRQCPLCRKPSRFIDVGGEQKLVDNFPVSRRNAANMMDLKTGALRVLVAGPQVFSVFDSNAKLGLNILNSNYIIGKEGTRMTTKYTLTRVDENSPTPEYNADDLIDLSKYEQGDSAEAIFALLDGFGIDYDALPLPTFELDDALAFVWPYGKHKGNTMEITAKQDLDYMKYMHGMKLDDGALGDPVFQALQTVLQDQGEVQKLDENAVIGSQPAPTPIEKAATVKLIDQNGNEVEVPESAKPALLAAGFTEPEPAPEPDNGLITMTKDGAEVQVPGAAVDAMLGQGYSIKGTESTAALPADTDEVVVEISGTKAEMLWAQAKPLVDTGVATFVSLKGAAVAAPAAVQNIPVYQPPAMDAQVKIKLNAIPAPIDIAFKDGLHIVATGQGAFIDPDMQAYAVKQGDAADAESVQAQAAAEQTDPPPAPADPEKPFVCDRCDWRGKTQGGLTQHINSKHGGVPNQGETAPAATDAAPAAASPAPQDASLLDTVKAAVASHPMASNYGELLKLFTSASGGEKNLGDMNDDQLGSVLAALQATA